MLRRAPRLALLAALLSPGLGACPDLPAPPAEPIPLAPGERAAGSAGDLSPLKPLAQKAPAKSSRPDFTLPPHVADALGGIEWEPLDFLEYLPDLAWAPEPECALRYVDLGTLSLSDSAFGSVKQSFAEFYVLQPKGPGRMLRQPGKRLEYMHLEAGKKRVGGFLDTSRLSRTPIPLEISAHAVDLPAALSPVFQLRTAKTVGHASPVHVWPTLPAKGEPTEWRYNLLFDKPEDLASRPPATVEFVGWIRLGFQRAAYLRATWPKGADPLPIGPDLAHLKVQGKRPRASAVSQLGDFVGHYLVSEHGHLVLAYVDGTARIHNVFSVVNRRLPKVRRNADYRVDEDRNFSFTTKLLEDCNGSLFSKVESEELSDAEVVALLEQFSSLMAIDRPKEAAELLSPAIRYAFPEGAPLRLIRETFRDLGSGFLGKPVPEKPGEEESGVLLVGKDRRKRRTFYGAAQGARIDGRPYLTFVGASSRRDRKRWDILIVEPGNIHSGAVKVFRP